MTKISLFSCIFDFFFVFLQPKLENCTHMRKIFVILSACLLSISAWAVVATPEPIEVTQPDGSVVKVKLIGDEFHSYYTLMDGTPVRRTDKGEFVKDASVTRVPESARKARKAAQQAKIAGSYPLTGSPKSLVILVNFTDYKFKHTVDDFQRMLNVSGYKENNGVGSARDYFIACSDSVFSPQFDCYGIIQLNNNSAYYDSHHGAMIVEACNKVADQGVDLTQYDTDNDGCLDNVFVYYAGNNEAEGAPSNTIWPHRSIVSSGERVQGKLIYDYACTSECRGSSGSQMCGIGTFCHEFGHVLGLPDYYDTDNSGAYTVGSWDIMCSGSYNGGGKTPPSYTAGERFQLGWLKPVQLKEAGAYTLEPLETSNKAFLIAKTDHNLSFSSPDPNEYWLLENRQRLGWDQPSSALPGTGMLIFHITYSAAAWASNEPNNNLPLKYDIEEAAGVKGYSSESDPFPGSYNVKEFTPMLHSKEIVEQPLYDITQVGSDITFTFKSNDFMMLPTDLPIIQSTYNPDNKKAYTPASRLKIVGEELEPAEDVTVTISGSGFTISLDSASWQTSLVMHPDENGKLDQDLFVRYAPRKQVCDVQLGKIIVRQSKKTGSYTVRATSPRPTLIDAPDITSVDEVTPTSFKVHWAPEEDAEYYYVTLYHMEPGEETTMESFEGFDDELTVKESGWYTSFYRTTTKAKEDGAVSMWFKENNETLLSPIYPLPVTKLSMWLSAPATTDSEVGFITLVAYGELGIDTLEHININKNTKKYTYTRDLDINKMYRRFRLEYTSLGGEGVCVDAFCTTFNEKIVYTHKGREKEIIAQEGDVAADYAIFYAYDLIPNTTYYVRLQCSESKGCTEHLSEPSMDYVINTKVGEPFDSRRLTVDCDSISYNQKTHVVYLPQSLTKGTLCIYNPNGRIVARIPVDPQVNVVPLPEGDLQRGAMYMIKYMPEDKMSRKSPWIKIIFY